MTPRTVSSRTHLPPLDGLRGLAVLVVIAHNVTTVEMGASLPEKLWRFYVDAGWIGVLLFFVLSGYLITGILLDERDGPRPLRDFYVRRSLRIFPLYYAFLAVRFLVLPRIVPSTAVPPSVALGYWLYLSNWTELILVPVVAMGHFWSLAVEEQFYLVWPWLTRMRAQAFARACVAIVLGSFAARVGFLLAGLPDKWLYATTVTRADALAMGALIALALRVPEWRARLQRWIRPGAGFATVALLVVMARAHGLSRVNGGVQVLGYSAIALLFALLLADLTLTPERTGARLLSFAPLRKIGTYSYAMYVLHVPLRALALSTVAKGFDTRQRAHPLLEDMAFVGALTVASLLAAMITYVALERPFLRLKDRLAPRSVAPESPVETSPPAIVP